MSRGWVFAVLVTFGVGYGLAAWLDDRYHQAHPDQRFGDYR